MSETGDLITRVYGSFRGVDFRGDEINLSRSPDSLNVWRDYKETESIRTRPGMKLKTGFTSPIYSISFYKGAMLVHSGSTLYRVKDGAKTALYSDLREGESNSFVFEDIWYFKDGKHYLRYDGTNISEVVGYIPTTSIARKPEGGGTVYEDVNMLSPYRINSFRGDGELKEVERTDKDGNVIKDDNGNPVVGTVQVGSKEYYLDAQDIDEDFFPVVTINDEPVSPNNIEVDYDEGKITLAIYAPKPLTDGQDNVFIKFKKSYSYDADGNKIETYKRNRERILGSTLLQVFDNRVFVSGNADHPNTVWHCSLNDPSYFSDLDYYREGEDDAAVKGLVAGNNALWAFREPSEANTTVFYHTPTIDSEYGKIYPSQHSSITTGCTAKAINFNDDIIFFSERGMEGISGDVTTEQAVAHRSSLVDRKLIAKGDYEGMVLAEWEGYLLVFIWDEEKKATRVYLADSRTAFAYENHIEYEWFYWELEKHITAARVDGGVLYLGATDGIYTLDDTEANVESYWVTPKDKFKSPHKLKTTNKRGCVVEAMGDISVYVKTEDTGFEFIGTYLDVADFFVSRIKRKKFKDIQLKFYSKTRFSLETATLECFVGGYIKRASAVSVVNPGGGDDPSGGGGGNSADGFTVTHDGKGNVTIS